MALTKTGLTFVNGTTPAINGTNLNKINDLTDDLVDYVETRSDLGETSVTQQITTIGTDSVGGPLTASFSGISDVNLASDNLAGCEVTTSWNTSNAALATDSSNEFEGTNCLKLTISADGGYADYDILSLLDTSKYYFISAYIKNVDLTSVKMQIDCEGDAGEINSSDISATTYTRVGVVIQPSDFNTATNVYLRFVGTGSNTEYAFYDALMPKEITSAEYALGADALLDKYPYHRGLASSNPQEFKTVGKNLFDKNTIQYGYYNTASGYAFTPDTSTYSTQKIRCGGGQNLTISGYNGTIRYIFWDINKEPISTNTFSTGSQTSPENAEYVSYQGACANFTIDSIQLELGSSATTYEAYKQTIGYTPVLRSVPAIADTFNDDGVKVQNVAEHTLLSGDIDSVANGTNLQRAVIGLDAFSGIKTQTASTIDLETLVSGLLAETDGYDTSGDAGKWYTDASNLYILAALGTWADVAAARTALTSTVTTIVNYQLATPITTQHDPLTLTAFENGTIYVEPVIKEQNVYSSGIAIDDSTLPISSLDYVNKLDPTTDVLTPIAISDCTVAGDGLSFTISGASNDEVYVYAYNYVNLSTTPTLAYNYPANTAGQTKDNSRGLGLIDARISMLSDRALADRNEIDLMNVLTTQGDLLYHDANGYQRLAKGTASQLLRMNSGATAPEWVNGSWEIISNTVTSTTASQIDVTIPNGYRFVKVFMRVESTGTQVLQMRFNDDSTFGNYKYNNVKDGSSTKNTSDGELTIQNGASADSITEITVECTGSPKSVLFANGELDGLDMTNGCGFYSGAGDITEINLIPDVNDFASGTEVLVLGVAEA